MLISLLTSSLLLWGFVFFSSTVYKKQVQPKVNKLFGQPAKGLGKAASSGNSLVNIKSDSARWKFFNELDTKNMLSEREQKIIDNGIKCVQANRQIESEQERQNESVTKSITVPTSPSNSNEEVVADGEVKAFIYDCEDAEETEAELGSAPGDDNIESDSTVDETN